MWYCAYCRLLNCTRHTRNQHGLLLSLPFNQATPQRPRPAANTHAKIFLATLPRSTHRVLHTVNRILTNPLTIKNNNSITTSSASYASERKYLLCFTLREKIFNSKCPCAWIESKTNSWEYTKHKKSSKKKQSRSSAKDNVNIE